MKPQAQPRAYVLPSEIPWFVTVKCRFEDSLDALLHSMPGCKFAKKGGFWWVPVEFADRIIDHMEDVGFEVDDRRPTRCGFGISIPPDFRKVGSRSLHDYQVKHADLALGEGRWIEGSEMGLGKSPIVLTAARVRYHGQKPRGIVIDLASHRRDWFDKRRPSECEFGYWWPEFPGSVEVIEDGKRARESTADVRIVSYHLLHKLALEQPVDFVFCDEAHMFQNPKTQWYVAANKLINERHPKAWVVAMTGTLIPEDTMTLYPILSLLWPNRYGWHHFDFGRRYSKEEENDFGKSEFHGTNEEHVVELRERLKWVSARTTKKEVGHLLPPFLVKLRWSRDDERLKSTLDWAAEQFANGAKHVTILTHFRKTAEDLSNAIIAQGLAPSVVTLTGETPPGRRHELIRDHKQRASGVIVATLHSVTTGLDLTFAPHVLFAEIYPRPVEMIQVLGRFHRMTSTEPADITILSREGGDPQAESLMNKIKAINLVLKAGTAEQGLNDALGELKSMGLTPEQVDDMLRSSVSEYCPDEF